MSLTPLMTSRQVADLVGVHPDTIRRWAELGIIACITLPSGHRRYELRDVEHLIAKAKSGN